MYYKLFKKFYVNKKKYEEFSKILFVRDEEINSVFCVSCGNACGFKNLCYNKICYRFICEFSYNELGKRIYTKEDLELTEEIGDESKIEIELCVKCKKNTNLDILNSENDLANFKYNEHIMMCYLKSNAYKSLDIDFDEILKFLPVIYKKYSSIKKF